ncbi:hypothetical protein KQ310_06585 [Synechococcus sp. CS-1328]|nr:hypothetical protein [Synechococcus sp. CS-1328]
MVRTPLVELSTLEAVAYRQKLRGGQAGVVILRHDSPQPGLALVNHRTGEPDLSANVPRDRFPREAFLEALELTSGLPYSRRRPVRSLGSTPQASASAEATDDSDQLGSSSPEAVATVASADYAAIVKAYTNRKGELSYELLNKSLIQAAHSNPFVATMISQVTTQDEIRDHVVKANFEAVSGNRHLSTAEVSSIVALLDEVSPRSVLRELNDEIRRMLGQAVG